MTDPDITAPATVDALNGGSVTPVAQLSIAAAVWREVLDELLRGVAHALSNRVATVSAAAYLASGGEPLDPDMAAALSAESERLERLLGDVRLLPAPMNAGVEPVMLTDAITQAVDLHRHHLGLREIPIRVHSEASTPPVAINPVALTHVLLVMLTALRLAARETTVIAPDGRATVPEVALHVSGDAQHARLVGTIDTTPRLPVREAVRLAEGCRAAAALLGIAASYSEPFTRVELVVPSLAAQRAARGS
jgi:hypothetical protein